MVHALFMLDTKGYKNAIITCNNYRFSSAEVLTCLDVTLYAHYISCKAIREW